jgi:hypothetical protein
MGAVIHRTTYEYKTSVHFPEATAGAEYPTATWLRNPDLTAVAAVAQKYWKVVSDTVLEMTTGEKTAVDLLILQEQYDGIIRGVARDVTQYHVGDDFIGVDMDWTKWTNDKVGAASSLTAMPLDHGQIQIRSGGLVDNYCALVNGLYAFRAFHNVILQTRVKLDQAANFNAFIGFYNNGSNKIEFSADTVGGFWKTYTVSGGATTVNTTSVAVDTAWHYFEIRASSVKVEFLIDGVVVATHEANITSEIMYFRTVIARTGGAVALAALIDFVYIDGKRSDN